MTLSSFFYLAKQGLMPGKGNRFMSFASIVVLASCLIITGLAVLLSANVNSFVDALGRQNEIVVYLKDDISEEQASEFSTSLSSIANIDFEASRYVSKEDALEEQKGYVGEFGELLSAYEGEKNPFPASYRIKIFSLESLEDTTQKLSALPGIEYITSPTDLADVLVGIDRAVSTTGWGLVAVLIMVSLVVIVNTIRLTVFARRKEINIMKYVGATNGFIRFPFFVEGVVIGIIAAVIAFSVVSGGYIALLKNVDSPTISWLSAIVPSLVAYKTVAPLMFLGFIVGGTGVGVAGSQISINSYLKV